MKQSEVGGQAVIEGVMMKNKEKIAIAVRNSDNQIILERRRYTSYSDKYKILKLPIIRGMLVFVESLIVGMKTLTFSASIFEEEEREIYVNTIIDNDNNNNNININNNTDIIKESTDNTNADIDEEEIREFLLRGDTDHNKSNKGSKNKTLKEYWNENKENITMGATVLLSIVLAVGIFMIIPYLVSEMFNKIIESHMIRAVLEGVIRLAIFIGYIAAISRLKDIQRVFMYHGAEHKVINCIESGKKLTVKNALQSSKVHKRCGTSFLLIVMIVSIIFFMFIRVDTILLRIVVRLLLVPIISGVAYEFIKFSGNSESKIIEKLTLPGLFLQSLTTREPDEGMIEVAIKSLEAVFDWREYLKSNDKNHNR